MNEHTAAERRLKTRIHYKNALRRDLVQTMRQLHEWQSRLPSVRNRRKAGKLRESISRYRDFVQDMRSFLAPLLDEIEEEIREEMSFSREEIEQFGAEVEEEKKLAADASRAFEEARKAIAGVEEEELDEEQLQQLHDRYSRAFRAFRLERHRLEEAEHELESELVDRRIFERELKRIMVERHFVSDS